MAAPKVPQSMTFDGRMTRSLRHAAEMETRPVRDQIRHYIRQGLTRDGYWDRDIQEPTEESTSPEGSDPSDN
jgi:hypothetical protein